MFSAGLSALVLICMNVSSRLTKIIFMRNKRQTCCSTLPKHLKSKSEPWLCISTRYGMHIKVRDFFITHTGHLCQLLTVYFHTNKTLITENTIWHNKFCAWQHTAEVLKEGAATNKAMHILKQAYSNVLKTKGIWLISVSCFLSIQRYNYLY